jgi:dephospho-CoA kinase
VPASRSDSPRPIGSYERRQAAVRPWDPRALDVAARVIAIIGSVRPDLQVEHIGSTSVPGLPGKGIVDLGTEADPAEIPAITTAMYSLGFGPQPGPAPWPATRPMHVGSVIEGGVEYRIHFHVHPRGTGDLAKDLRFRDALRADPALVEGYARIKQGIVDRAGGPLDGTIYQSEKGGWILDVYDRLGIERPANVGSGPIGEAGDPASHDPNLEDARDG